MTREQRLYKDWTVLLRADGQWSPTPLFANEQYGMGGLNSVRGYFDGETYGDSGWHLTVEPRTPLVNVGMADGTVPVWMRSSVFMDYGQTFLADNAPGIANDQVNFWGVGWSLIANIGRSSGWPADHRFSADFNRHHNRRRHPRLFRPRRSILTVMQTQNIHQKIFLALGRMMPGVILLLLTRTAEANPTGMTVQSGTASTSVNGSQLNITAGNNAFLNWQSFNIAPGETTVFNQPSAASVVWNRVNDPNPSQIFGSLQANGVVVLLNSSGFYFGPNSFVSAAGLVVSTANYAPPQNTGGAWEFNGPPPLASIVNYGTIKIGSGGSAFLIADQIENNGDIEAPGGSIGLAAGQTVRLSERPDGRGMSMNVVLPQGSVNNAGHLIADAGTIALNAKVVNQNGFIEANSVRNQDGVIELVASDALNFGTASRIVAAGDSSAGGSAGGSITLQSGNVFNDVSGSEISVAGGANGGDGGAVEISAPVMPALNTTIDGQAQAGSAGGKLLLVPDYIVLDTSGGDTVNSSGTVSVGSPGGTLHLNVGTSQSAYNDSAFKGLSKITLQAQFDITLADGTSWSLSDSTGQTSGLLTLEAGRNIIFGNSTSLYDLNNWSIALYAGVTDFAHQTVTPGAGSIYLNAFNPNDPNNSVTDPSGYIQTAAGSVTLVAGQDIIVGTGYVNTTGGGSINAHALAGNIDTGGYAAQGYAFQSADSAGGGYYVDTSHGISGMSTIAGGDVNLTGRGQCAERAAQHHRIFLRRRFLFRRRRSKHHHGRHRRLWFWQRTGREREHCRRRQCDGKLSRGQRHWENFRGRDHGRQRQSRQGRGGKLQAGRCRQRGDGSGKSRSGLEPDQRRLECHGGAKYYFAGGAESQRRFQHQPGRRISCV